LPFSKGIFQGENMRKLSLLVILFISFFAYSDNPFQPLVGNFHISSAPIADPKAPLPNKTHLYLSISGEVAQEIYTSLNGEPKLNKCDVNHYQKSAGNFICSYYPTDDKYSCDFSVNIQVGKLDSAGFC